MDITILNLHDYRLRCKELASREKVVNNPLGPGAWLKPTCILKWTLQVRWNNVSLLLVHLSFHPTFEQHYLFNHFIHLRATKCWCWEKWFYFSVIMLHWTKRHCIKTGLKGMAKQTLWLNWRNHWKVSLIFYLFSACTYLDFGLPSSIFYFVFR